jgi:stalled ribosome rescue protein Dom34
VKKEIGLWIDHRQVVIVTLLEKEHNIERITSHAEKRIRYSAGSSEDNRDRRIEAQLSKYYDEVIAKIHEADSIFIMGPGEAKNELQKRLEAQKRDDCVVMLKTMDKMSYDEIVAEVRWHFRDVKEGQISYLTGINRTYAVER